jgi:hypothetical protein
MIGRVYLAKFQNFRVTCSGSSLSMKQPWNPSDAHGVPRAWHPIFVFLIFGGMVQADDAPIGLADLEAYRMALSSKPDESAPLVLFRDLWDRPEAYAGKPVTVEGRLARRFKQPRLGDFPPLVEAWVVSEVGDPFCIVFAEENGTNPLEIGSSVRFSGKFLRRIKYQAGDTARIVPLIVGPGSPSLLAGSQSETDRAIETASKMVECVMALGISAMVMFLLVRLHFSRQVGPPRRFEPDPIFIDGNLGPEEEIG